MLRSDASPWASRTGRRVAVCALTYRRPVGLRRLLAGLAELRVPPALARDVEVVIVDNDPAGSGASVVAEGARRLPWPLRYVVEPRRGIAHGRNRAVAEARGADLVAFLDDDERPNPSWLTGLLVTHRETGADVVTGPVLPVFEEPPPEWVRRGAFFERRRHPHGARIHYARTSNVLITRPLLDRWPGPFETDFALNGGDDTHFFKRAHLAGARIVWSETAIVSEWIPPSRVSARWLLTRAYRRGTTLSQCLVRLEDSPRRRAKRLGAAGYLIATGGAVAAVGALRGREHRVAGLRRVWHGGGLARGLFGAMHPEYLEVHGR